MDPFAVFFTFYALLLGLAVTEVLSGLAAYVRNRPLHTLEPQSALLALLIFAVICATWIDAWITRSELSLSFAGMWAPVGAATAYFLAASVVLPRDAAQQRDMPAYFASRKGFVVAMLIAAELFVKVTYLPRFAADLAHRPMLFWLLALPLNIVIFALYTIMLLARRKAVLIAAIVGQIAVFVIVYWWTDWINAAIRHAYDYA